ncbi:MAG: hypothetical protein KAI47_05130, partial [Deltaproteobacteria bacterium]|nr:hypothetical protein [Deltaproteobacteria bacterium]
MADPSFVVGIDLGTTNTVISYVDTRDDPDEQEIRVLPIPQHTAPGVIEDAENLPSFLYLAA